MSRQRTRLRVRRVYKIISGSPTTQALSTAWGDGSSFQVENAADFDPDGGVAIIAPVTDDFGNTSGETILYTGVNEDTDQLTGVTRSNPQNHPSGTFVQEGESPTVEKWAEGFIDDEDAIRSVPVPAALYPLLHLGTYDDDTAPTIPVEYEEDEDALFVAGGPVGAVPEWDADLEVLPAAGGGDASQGQQQPDGTIKLPPGQGFEDGKPPDFAVIPNATGSIGNTILITYELGSNSSTVRYQLHGLDEDTRTARGGETWEPQEDTLIESQTFAGTSGPGPAFMVADFPEGHVLHASASDPPDPGVSYFFKIVPADGSGDAEGPYPEAGPVSPIKIETIHIDDGAVTEALLAANAVTETKIADDSISTPKLVAGAVQTANIAAGAVTANEIAAQTITGNRIAGNTITGGNIAGLTVTADKLAANSVIAGKIAANAVTANEINVSTLSAITANLGSITAGTITAVTYTSAGSGRRVRIESSVADAVQFIGSDGNLKGWAALTLGDVLQLRNFVGDLDLVGTNILLDGILDFSLTTQTGKTGMDAYLPIKVNGTTRFLRLFN